MVERCPDKTEVDGSIPSTLTLFMLKNIITIIFVLILLAIQIFFYVNEKNKRSATEILNNITTKEKSK